MIIIIDFGSQFTQLVARRVRELGVYSEIISYKNETKILEYLKNLKKNNIKGFIFSGGPFSVYEKGAPSFSYNIEEINLPILGICYGFQLINFLLGGKVSPSPKREYGFEKIHLNFNVNYDSSNPISALKSKNIEHQVWMSHGDEIKELSSSLVADSYTRSGVIASYHHKQKKIYGLQFHPEVEHSECGKKLIKHFIKNTCKCDSEWTSSVQIDSIINNIKNKIKFSFSGNSNNKPKAICALSGGVDSCVAAVLSSLIFGENLHCIFIDNGLLRKNEFQEILKKFTDHLNLNVNGIDASDLFLSRLKNITNAEEKRKIIGHTFIEVFETEAKKIQNVKYLIQGTLYPDVVESVPIYGSSSTIKTHHNVGGLPQKMSFELIEPLRELFKDEVRKLGKKLGIPDALLYRHPFPGPGLAVRVLSDITKKKLDILREADAILIEELKLQNLYDDIWQAFVVLLPVYTVGVMGDARTYENVAAIRCVSSIDGMTADWSRIPHDFLAHVSSRITNEVKGINRVVYDISSKPPSTIEWE